LALAAGAYGASGGQAQSHPAASLPALSGPNAASVLIAAAVVLIAAVGLRRSLNRRD
jgi:hypothetical protein